MTDAVCHLDSRRQTHWHRFLWQLVGLRDRGDVEPQWFGPRLKDVVIVPIGGGTPERIAALVSGAIEELLAVGTFRSKEKEKVAVNLQTVRDWSFAERARR